MAAEGSWCTAEDEEEKGIVRIVVVAVGLAEADHRDCVGKGPRGCMVGVGAVGADRVKDVVELGVVETPSIVVGVESFGIAAATAEEEQREDANIG